MVLKIPNLVIKTIAFGGMGYLKYLFFFESIYINEQKIKKLEAFKEHKRQLGEKFQHNEITQKVQDYMDNHYGQKILERMQTQHLLQEQIQYAITKKVFKSLQSFQKQELKDRLIQESSEEEVAKIEEEIQKMNELFSKVKTNLKVIKDQDLIKREKK